MGPSAWLCHEQKIMADSERHRSDAGDPDQRSRRGLMVPLAAPFAPVGGTKPVKPVKVVLPIPNK